MLDPLAPPPQWLRSYSEPWTAYFNVPALSEHIHEVLAAFLGYLFIQSYLSPRLSARFLPRIYQNFNERTKLNWNVHVVSLIQSTLVNSVALWVMFTDKERKSMNAGERVYGYSGGCGLVAALAAGYFVYDLIISTVHINIFGIGMFFHAVSALWVFSFGFRPFLNFYGPTFILYELSSPFLNIHWFLDKVNMTGSKAQWYNGMALLFVFFSCRLVWGTWQSVLVYKDMWTALQQTWTASGSSLLDPIDISSAVFRERNGTLCVDETCARANAEISKFASHTAAGVPLWLAITYVTSNLILNSLNYYWFSKMIETVLKRFREPTAPKVEPADLVLDAAASLEEEEGRFEIGDLAGKEATTAVETANNEELRRRKA